MQNVLKTALLDSGAGFTGFADISDIKIPDSDGYPTAISIGVPYDTAIIDRLDSDVDSFNRELEDTYQKAESLIVLCQNILKKYNYDSLSHFSKNLPGLLSTFSHKMAATKAGLGWIGKSSLFISNEYGCRVRLATVLTDAPFITGEPVTESKCGDCTLCMDACPYDFIRGKNWYPGIGRDELLDASLCDKKRGEYIEKTGYRNPCGLCLKACPVGKREEK